MRFARAFTVCGPLMAGLCATLAQAAPQGAPPAAPAAPGPPALPAAPSVPKAPAMPSAPALPKAPAMPSMPGAGGAPAAPTAASTPEGAGAPAAASTLRPAIDGAGTSLSTDSTDEDDDAPRSDLGKPDESGLPNTLPRGLRRTARGTVEEDTGASAMLAIEDVSTSPVSGGVNRSESVRTAPALALVFTQAMLRARGYTNLSEILDDLPSTDVQRSFGRNYALASFRGVRAGDGSVPYVVVVDGMVMNDVFTGDAQLLASVPMSNVERIEVTFGPAAAYFGQNAALAVINITTRNYDRRQALGDYGASLDARVSYGGSGANVPYRALATKVVDATAAYVGREFVFRVAARIEAGYLDRSLRDQYAFLSDAVYSDGRLWGRRLFEAYPTFGGRFESPDNKTALDARVQFKDIEVGYQFYGRESGQGVAAAGDRMQTAMPVSSFDDNVYVKHSLNVSRDTRAVTILRRQRSVVDPTSAVLVRRKGEPSASWDFATNPVDGPMMYSYAQTSFSTALQSDFTSVLARNALLRKDELSLSAGLRYAMTEVATDLEISSAAAFPIRHPLPSASECLTTPLVRPSRDEEQLVPSMPTPIAAGRDQEFIGCTLGDRRGDSDGRDPRHVTRPDVFGSYLSARYEFLEHHTVHVGMRVDGSTASGSSAVASSRLAYVGTFDAYALKLLYGQAAVETSAYDRVPDRLGSPFVVPSPAKPPTFERSQTAELQLEGAFNSLTAHAGAYFNQIADPRSTFDDAALRARQTVGGELVVRWVNGPVRASAMYSRMFLGREWGTTAAGTEIERGLGDIARDKAVLNATYTDGPFVMSATSRIIGARTTIPTNPVAEIPAYVVLDTNAILKNLPYQGLAFGLRVSNVLDTQYAHPGIGMANAGIGPATFLPNGGYLGSLGVDSSILPQPRRTVMVTVSYEQ